MKSVGIITLFPLLNRDYPSTAIKTAIEGDVMYLTHGIEKTMYAQSIISALSGKDVLIAWLVAVVVITSFALLA